jgi:hypothetical protein
MKVDNMCGTHVTDKMEVCVTSMFRNDTNRNSRKFASNGVKGFCYVQTLLARFLTASR